jgi:hypothetical protein
MFEIMLTLALKLGSKKPKAKSQTETEKYKWNTSRTRINQGMPFSIPKYFTILYISAHNQLAQVQV